MSNQSNENEERAFPSTYSLPENVGLTKRELFAAMAMQGSLASGDDVTDAVGHGLRAADALLAALKETV